MILILLKRLITVKAFSNSRQPRFLRKEMHRVYSFLIPLVFGFERRVIKKRLLKDR